MSTQFTIDGLKFNWTRDHGLHVGTAEASSLGLSPGGWPGQINITGRRNDVVFTASAPKYDVDGDIVWIDYHSGRTPGVVIRIFND